MMKTFISWRHAAFMFLSLSILASGCKDSDPKPATIEVEDFETTIDENLHGPLSSA